MKLFGLEKLLGGRKELSVEGTAYAERSLHHLIQAAAPRPPQASPSYYVGQIPPFGSSPPQRPASFDELDPYSRTIYNDPRESFYWVLTTNPQPAQIEQILRATLGGDLWQGWVLLQKMLDTWPTFKMAQHQLREAVAYAKFNFHPYTEDGEEPTPKAKEKAGLVSRAFKGMNPSPFNDEAGASKMVYDFCDAMLIGMSVQEMIWEDRNDKVHGKETMPRTVTWVHPRHVTFTSTGEVAVFSDDYSRLYADPATKSQNVSGMPDPDKFLCAQYSSKSGSCLGAGLMRQLAWLWGARQWAHQYILQASKKHGTPFLKAFYDGTYNASDRSTLEKYLQMAGANNYLLAKSGAVLDVVPPVNMGTDNPCRFLIEEADRMGLYLLLGQSGTTEATPGKLGESNAHADVKGERIIGLASWVARGPLRQFARAVLRKNYGDDDECPNIEADFTRPLDSVAVGQLATALATSTLAVRADEGYKKLGFTQPDEGDLVMQGGKLVYMGTIQNQDDIDAAAAEQANAIAGLNPDGTPVAPVDGEGISGGDGEPASGPGDEPTAEDVAKEKGGGGGRGNLFKKKAAKVEASSVRASLSRATDAELAGLEDVLVRAEESAAAGRLNGEYAEIQARVTALGNNKRFDYEKI